ncbi:MAG: efflux RND transporter permease subunit [Candidatus Moduliflexus flocculans]|nr:efflux RND transporter permease subunit [Candidatus Moduliflexus flocculans]
MLGGIVVNNAIIIVDYTNLLRRRDKLPIREAIEEAGRRRLRPILMTAFTTIMATLPLALGLGEGGEAQAPAGPGRHRRAAELDAHHAHRRPGRLQHLRGLPAEEGAWRGRRRRDQDGRRREDAWSWPRQRAPAGT